MGESNWKRKGEVCEGAIVRLRGELSDCQRRVGGMSDKQLGDYGKDLDKQLKDPANSKRRGELCEHQQICRHEQHERVCDRHFPGTDPVPSPERQADQQQSIEDLLKAILQGGERYGEAATGVDQSPKDARSALQDLERDFKQLRGDFQQRPSPGAARRPLPASQGEVFHYSASARSSVSRASSSSGMKVPAEPVKPRYTRSDSC